MKKGFIHIKEYDLTKLLLDSLEIDIEDEFELVHEITPLYYKDRQLILPEYTQYKKYSNTGVVIRPFVNISHAQYLINMFSDIKSCNVLFEYSDNEKNGLDGILFITDRNGKKRNVNFYGLDNLPVLMSTVLLKTILGHTALKPYLKDVFKIDKRLTEKWGK